LTLHPKCIQYKKDAKKKKIPGKMSGLQNFVFQWLHSRRLNEFAALQFQGLKLPKKAS